MDFVAKQLPKENLTQSFWEDRNSNLWIWDNGADALAQAEDNVSNYVSPGLNVRNCNVTKFSFGIFSSHNKATNKDEETLCSGYIYLGSAWNCCNFTISQEIMLFKPLNQVELGTDYLWPKLPIKPLKNQIYIFSFAGESSSLIGRREDLMTSKKVRSLTKQRAEDFALSSLFCWIRTTNRP